MDRENKMSEKDQSIPIKNLFFMLCYAWNVLSIKDTVKLEEEKIENVYNLLTRLLVFGVRKIVKQGFNRSYVEKEEPLQTVHGKICINETVKLRLKKEVKCVCTYDDFSKNNKFNQIVKFTMNGVLKNQIVDEKLKREIKELLFFFNGIDTLEPSKEIISRLNFNRNNQYYKMLIHVCVMIHEGTMADEKTGQKVFKDFFQGDQMQRVYEKFILNFYNINLDKVKYKVHAPKINWKLDKEDSSWNDFFELEFDHGERRTDIVIENKNMKYQFIIDAKYYRDMLIEKYHNSESNTYRTAHLNQIRGYILDSDYEGRKFGALVYPTVYNDKYDKGILAPIKDAYIILKTLDLNRDWKIIHDDLMTLVARIESAMIAERK